MGLVSGMVMGTIVGIALMAGWSRMMRYRSTKRVAKVCVNFSESFFVIVELYYSILFSWYLPLFRINAKLIYHAVLFC
jgi:hypothetical protein